MKKWHHVLLNSAHHRDPEIKKSHDTGYVQLFTNYPPEEILVLNTPDKDDIHSGIISAAMVHGVEPKSHDIIGVEPPTIWTEEELALRPFEILESMIDGLRESGLNRKKVVVTIVGGTTLHSTLLLSLSRAIGATVIVNEGDQYNPNFLVQPWLSNVQEYTSLKSHEKKIISTFLKTKSGVDLTLNEFTNSDFWQSSIEISGGDIDASMAKGLNNSVKSLVNNGLLLQRGNDPVQYRLTAMGWSAALTNTQLGVDDLQKIKSRSSRITGFRLKRRGEQVPAVDIARTCSSSVEDWLTIMGLDGKEGYPGVNFNEQNPESVLDEAELSMHQEWLDFLNILQMNEQAWCYLNTHGNQEEIFANFCEWIWPKLTTKNPNRYWSIDLTQFTNKQIPFVSHLALCLGIPMTWTLAPRGHTGIKSGVVNSEIVNRRHRIYSVPNIDFTNCLLADSRKELGIGSRFLIALLYKEEHYVQANRQMKIVNPLTTSGTEEIGERSATRKSLFQFVNNHSSSFVREKLSFKDDANTTRQYQRLVREGMIRISTQGKSGTHHLTLSPLGKLVARILRDRAMTNEEEE
tara:strand:+ start:1881 stop:3605 length:1725 start_codon:yes stop_codon:yes gene_type:complete